MCTMCTSVRVHIPVHKYLCPSVVIASEDLGPCLLYLSYVGRNTTAGLVEL